MTSDGRDAIVARFDREVAAYEDTHGKIPHYEHWRIFFAKNDLFKEPELVRLALSRCGRLPCFFLQRFLQWLIATDVVGGDEAPALSWVELFDDFQEHWSFNFGRFSYPALLT